MTINNLAHNVPSQVRALFQSSMPFGKDYVMYCSSYTNLNQVYDLIYFDNFEGLKHFQVTYSNNEYVLSEVSENSSYDGFSVSKPYYCYSSIRGQGIYESSPISSNFQTIMLVVICSLLVLRCVFGGVRLWKEKRKSYV